MNQTISELQYLSQQTVMLVEAAEKSSNTKPTVLHLSGERSMLLLTRKRAVSMLCRWYSVLYAIFMIP